MEQWLILQVDAEARRRAVTAALKKHGGLTRAAGALRMDPQRLLAVKRGEHTLCVWEAMALADTATPAAGRKEEA